LEAGVQALISRHKTHIPYYGRDNIRRLTGKHETADVRRMINL